MTYFQKGRNTTHALLHLQSEINEATLHESSLYAIFFDLQEVHYLQTEYEFGLRDNVPSILQSFFNDRYLLVRNSISSSVPVQSGVRQG